MRILWLLLVPLVTCTIYTKLSNYGQTQLLPGDSLVSTEGLFMATLQQAGCTFQVQRFINGAYQSVGNYSSSSLITACSVLSINGSYSYLITDTFQIYLALNQMCNISNFLIDDNGVFHLICIPQNFENNGSEINITLFQTNQTFLQSSGSAIVDTSSVLSQRTNLGGWSFQASGGSFSMYNPMNSAQSVNYSYTGFTIYPANLLDANLNAPPRWSTFPYTRFQPRCGYLNYFSFLSPYVFIMDPYWPMFTVKDQTGYPILQLTYPTVNCVNDYGLLITQQFNCVEWVCPEQLFEFNGSCVTTCPAPYFHFIKRNQSRCVLNCQTGSTRDNTSRICTCGPYNAPACPVNSTSYTKGCICSAGYYDGIACLSSCPSGFLANNGLCLNCPYMCATCTISTAIPKFSYLTCLQCQPGFVLTNDKCVKACNPLVAQTLQPNGACQTCSDPNCANCSSIASTCSQCTPFYLLQSGICVLNCSSDSVLSYIQFNSFICLPKLTVSGTVPCQNYSSVSFNQTAFVVCTSCPIGSYIHGANCVTDCPSVNSVLINDASFGVCKCPTGYIMINVTCYQISTCPIKMTYSPNLGMCLSCPYGCLTCIANSFPIICTSCTPGFIFFAYSFPYCGFNSPYYQCINDYSLVGNYSCIPNNPSTEYLLCLFTVTNCRVCVYNNAQVCIACNLNFYLYNNTCITVCPTGTFPGQGQCLAINPFAPNCLNNTIIKSWSSYSAINYTVVSQSMGYNYYTFNGYLPDNNPVGSIFSSTLGTDNSTRYTYVRDAGYYCPKCIDGYAADFYGRCIICPPPCATCVIADVNWCITCLDGTPLVNGRTCGNGNGTIICTADQYKRSDGLCINFCSVFYLQVPYQGINCSQSCPVGYFPTYNIFSTKTTRYWCNQTLTGWTGILGLIGPTSFSGYDYQNFLQFQCAMYRKRDGRTLAYMIPFNQFYSVSGIQFPQYFIVGNTSPSITYNFPPEWFNLTYNSSYYYYNTTTGQYVFNTSYLSTLPPSSPYYNWYNITNQSYLLINTTGRPSLFLVNLNNNVTYPSLMSNIYTFPANLYYGLSYGSSRPQSVWKKWVAVGAVFSIILLLLHVIYIGNDIMYKVDNTLILAQTVYLGEFVWAVMPIEMAQFFWGWFFAHLGFIPNIFRDTIPTTYTQNAPLPYRLVSEDANIIRNAGFAFTCLVFFLGVYLLVVTVTLLIRTLCMKYQVWWPYILKNCLLAFLELLFMIIFYWAVTELRYGSRLPTSSVYFKNLSFGIAILFIVLIIIYTIIRFFFSTIGGIYCMKRILIALVFAFTQEGTYWICFLYAIEVVFFAFRILIEKPFLCRHITTMIVEQVLIVAVYSVVIFARHNFAALVIITTLIICMFTFMLLYDLLRVYTDSRNEWDYYEDLYEKNSQVVIGSERAAI